MEQLTLDLVMAAVTRLSLNYPNSGHTPESLKSIAEDWLFDFVAAGIKPERFASMVILARRRGKWFPTIAEMMDYHREMVSIDARKRDHRRELPPPSASAEEKRRTSANFRKLISLAQSGKNPEECAEEMDVFIATGSVEIEKTPKMA